MRHAGARVALTEEGPEVGDGPSSTIDGAAVYYTSGSTGAPKAFVVSDEAQLQLGKSCAEGYGLQTGEHAALIFHHSFGAAACIAARRGRERRNAACLRCSPHRAQ